MSVFVPNADYGSRTETAVALVGAASEYGLDDRSVKAIQGGFIISDELAEVLYSEGTDKTSGNRAAKTNKSKED